MSSNLAIVLTICSLAVTAPVLAQTPAPAAPPPAAAPEPAPVAPPDATTAEAPLAPPPASAPAPVPVAVVPTTPAPAPAPAAPKALEVGSGGGDWKPGGLLQFWLYGSHQIMHLPGVKARLGDEKTLTFRLRRAEVRVKGDIIPKRVAFQVMIDPARALEQNKVDVKVVDGGGGKVTVMQQDGPLTILQDFFITFPSDYVDLSVGQFKIPVSLEGYNSSSKILFPERAGAARYFGDKRDIGLRLEKKLGNYFGYSAGIFNGAGQNKLDNDTEKDAALRLEVFPVEGLTVAGVGYTTVGKRKKSSRDRLEADLRYDAHNVYLLAEYIAAWDTAGGGKAVRGHGSYVEAAYTFIEHLQPMVRVGEVEPAVDSPGDHYRHYDLGVNWLFQKNEAKIGASFSVYDPTAIKLPSNPDRIEGILAAQASF